MPAFGMQLEGCTSSKKRYQFAAFHEINSHNANQYPPVPLNRNIQHVSIYLLNTERFGIYFNENAKDLNKADVRIVVVY